MKTIGLIGGLSWHSSAEYYRIINEEIHKRRGQSNSAKLILYSFNFQEIIDLQKQDRWDVIQGKIIDAGRVLVRAGAELVAFGANTTHRFAEAFEQEISLPLIHIADVTAKEVLQKRYRRVGLLGTKPTMQLDFFKNRLSRNGIETVVPSMDVMERIHSIIFSELVNGVINSESRASLLEIADGLGARGAEGIILGCTELPLILKQTDSKFPIFNTIRLHAEAIAKAALS